MGLGGAQVLGAKRAVGVNGEQEGVRAGGAEEGAEPQLLLGGLGGVGRREAFPPARRVHHGEPGPTHQAPAGRRAGRPPPVSSLFGPKDCVSHRGFPDAAAPQDNQAEFWEGFGPFWETKPVKQMKL